MIRLAVSRGETRSEHTLERDDVLLGAAPDADVTLDEADGPWLLLFLSPAGWRYRGLGLVPVTEARVASSDGVLAAGDVLDVAGFKVTLEELGAGPAVTEGRPGKPPPLPLDAQNRDAAGFLVGTPLGKAFDAQQTEGFRPHLEVHDTDSRPPRTLPLGREPILFGADPGCQVKVGGLRVPDFLATVETHGRKVTARRVTPAGLLGPKVLLDGDPLRDEVELHDGQRLFLGDITVFVRLRRR
ncbi:MAG: hypothetical protein HY904_20275 [Deltaproteobacteria bacterium]|nr:hypothetical protein [Deltaproteobacteria bacterium]